MRILITGSLGQLAQDCQKILEKNYDLALYSRKRLDITDPKKIEETFKKDKPDILINCAAYNQVDTCESDRSRAHEVNALGPKYLALAGARVSCRMIHISTDYVFDGKKDLPKGYVEADEPHPLSYYGTTKLAGEMAVRSAHDRNLVIRTAWLYGIHGNNFVKTMIQLASQGKSIRVVDDQFGNLTWTYRLAEQIKKLIETNAQGLYHATAEGYASRFEIVKTLFEKLDWKVDLSPCSSEEYKTAAQRPKNSVLENQRMNQEGLNLMKPWREDLEEFILRYRSAL